MAGSNSDPIFFTPTERSNFQTILNRLWGFEKSVAHSFRQFEERLGNLEENVKINKNSLTGTKGSVTKLRNSLKEMENKIKDKLNITNSSWFGGKWTRKSKWVKWMNWSR